MNLNNKKIEPPGWQPLPETPTKKKPVSGPEKRLWWFIIISILLHFLFGFFYGVTSTLQLPLLLNDKSKEDKQIVFEVVETPEQAPAQFPPDQAKYYSDKNSRASNPQSSKQKGETPFSAGTEAYPIIPKAAGQPATEQAGAKATEKSTPKSKEKMPDAAEENFSYAEPPRQSFSRDLLLGRETKPDIALPQPQFDSRDFSVDDLGGLAFNTYNWNFAPYMLYLKKRIEQHIFPPPAFTKLGMIEGRTVLRFLISKDGSLRSLSLLNYEGHFSLMETSMNAVNGSSPFRPLPSDFPEELLEVTGTFVYKVYR